MDDDMNASEVRTSGEETVSPEEELAELKGSVADMRAVNEALLAANKSMREEIISIRKDVRSMNEVIKNLLAIYETVCQERNPFRREDSCTLVRLDDGSGDEMDDDPSGE